jgi:AcrR family transcriptional regulator
MMAARDPVVSGKTQRSDARRNQERLLAAARAVFAEDGADGASLNEIVRRAGVGAGTLYRHFPTRESLVEAVFRDQVDALCSRAYELRGSLPPGEALAVWLRAVVVHLTACRGLATSMMNALRTGRSAPPLASYHDSMHSAGSALLVRAQEAGVARAGVSISDLLTLANAISWATDQGAEGANDADRLLSLMAEGWRLSQPASTERE